MISTRLLRFLSLFLLSLPVVLPADAAAPVYHAPVAEQKVIQPQMPQITVTVQQPKSDPSEEAAPQRWRPREWWVFGFGAGSLAANIALAIGGIWGIRTAVASLKEIQRQNLNSEKALILQFRPKVVVRGMIARLEGADKGHVGLILVNTGSSTAHLQATELTFRVIQAGKTEFVMTSQLEKADLKPGEQQARQIRLVGAAANAVYYIDELTKQKRPNNHSIFLSGTFVYTDSIGTTRMTGIFRTYHSPQCRFIPVADSDIEFVD